MKHTLNTINVLMEIQAANALHQDRSISFAGNTCINALRQVKETLEEEITVCGNCGLLTGFDEMIIKGEITAQEAERLEAEGLAGKCCLHARCAAEDDFCSFAVRRK